MSWSPRAKPCSIYFLLIVVVKSKDVQFSRRIKAKRFFLFT